MSTDATLICGDCLEVMRGLPAQSVDLVMCSPPYEAARTYGIGFKLRGQDWVDWCVERFLECLRVCRGLVAWVVEGQTRDYRYSAGPLLLAADLHRRGVHLRKPPAFVRHGIPGSSGPDWFRNDYEFVICGTNGGRLPWSDNTAMGHSPKWAPGGDMSYRLTDGSRKNDVDYKTRRKERGLVRAAHGKKQTMPRNRLNGDRGGGETTDGSYSWNYMPPKLANPGNVIRCIVGGGKMGSKLAHENEAPFPERIAEFFIRSFCPPGGTVLDPFSGSGTTGAVAIKTGRKYIGIDVRESQVDLTRRRLEEVQKELQFA